VGQKVGGLGIELTFAANDSCWVVVFWNTLLRNLE
jgi:hypothetical protein